MMRYGNREHNKNRNEMIQGASLLGLVLAVAALGHILAETDSLLIAAGCLLVVLCALGASSIRNIRA